MGNITLCEAKNITLLMQYKNIKKATFLSRPNRFIAKVECEGEILTAHVKNTGRCRELLVEGAQVYLEFSDNPTRKTPCDLVAVERVMPSGETILINMYSAAPNAAAMEWLNAGGLGQLQNLRAEKTVGESRFDFYAEQNGTPVYIEVKGCTLIDEKTARFPDAPTQRGLRHVQHLTELKKQGARCIVLIVIQCKGVETFSPNWETHAAFGHALRQAKENGVELYAVDCIVTPDSTKIDQFVQVVM